MQQYIKSLSPLLVMLLLIGCDNSVGNTKQVRQNTLTISDSPVFPYTKNSSNRYTLLLSNHANSELKLQDSKLDEFVFTSTPESSVQAIKLEELVNIKACSRIAAKSDCTLEIILPKQVSNGFYTFTLNYTNNKNQDYPLTKFIAFNDDIASNNGITVTNKNIETITENLNKFTLALPFYLSQDFKDIQIQDLGKSVPKYTIQCNSLAEDKTKSSNIDALKAAAYPANTNCTLIVDLDSSNANHTLILTGLNTNDQRTTSVVNTRTVFGDYAHLIYTGAPLLLNKGESKSVYIHNIGTTAARDVVLQQNLKAGSTAAPISGTSQTSCLSNIINPGASCELKYVANDDKASILEQTISYPNRSFGIEPDNYLVYINTMSRIAAPTVGSIYPANNTIFNYHQRPESIIVEFSAPIDGSTINDTNFRVQKDMLSLMNPIFGHFSPSYINFTPESSFAPGVYTISLSNLANQQGAIADTNSSFTIRKPLMVERSSTIGSEVINLGGNTNIQSSIIPEMKINFSEELQSNSVEVIILQGAACARLPRESVGNCPVVRSQINTIPGKTITTTEVPLANPSDYGVFVKNAKARDGQQLDQENPLWLQPITHFTVPFVLNLRGYLDQVLIINCASSKICMGGHRGFVTVPNSGAYNIYLPNKKTPAANSGYTRLEMRKIMNAPTSIDASAITYPPSLTNGFPVVESDSQALISALNLVTSSGDNHPLFFFENGRYHKGVPNRDFPTKICDGSIDTLLGLASDKWRDIHTIFTAPLNEEIQNAKWVIFKNQETMITNSDFTEVLWRGRLSEVWPDLTQYANNIGSVIPYVFNNVLMLALVLRDGNTAYLDASGIQNVSLLSTANDLPGSCIAP